MKSLQKEIEEYSTLKNPIVSALDLPQDEALPWLVLYGNFFQGIEPIILLDVISQLKSRFGSKLFQFPLIAPSEFLKELDIALNGRFWALRDYAYGILTHCVEAHQKGTLLEVLKEKDPVVSGTLLRKNLFYIGKNNPYSSKIRLILHFIHSPAPMGLGGACDYVFIPPHLYWGHPRGLGFAVKEGWIKPWDSKDRSKRIVDLKSIASYLCKDEPCKMLHWHFCKLFEPEVIED